MPQKSRHASKRSRVPVRLEERTVEWLLAGIEPDACKGLFQPELQVLLAGDEIESAALAIVRQHQVEQRVEGIFLLFLRDLGDRLSRISLQIFVDYGSKHHAGWAAGGKVQVLPFGMLDGHFALDLSAGGGITQPAKELIETLVGDPWWQRRSQRGPAGHVWIHVGGHINSRISRSLQFGHYVRHASRSGLSCDLEMENFDRNMRFTADP